MSAPRRQSTTSTNTSYPSSVGSLPPKPAYSGITHSSGVPASSGGSGGSSSSNLNGIGRRAPPARKGEHASVPSGGGIGAASPGLGAGDSINPAAARASGGKGAPLSRPPGQGRRLGSFNSLANHPSSIPGSRSKVTQVNGIVKHPLDKDWTFWFLGRNPSRKMSEEEFGKAMRRLGSCSYVEDFFSLYLHIRRPSQLLPISDLHLFLTPIKPVWEDPLNISGGKWTIRLRKGLADRLWEGVVLALVGGILESGASASTDAEDTRATRTSHQQSNLDEELKEVCGAVLSIRREEDLLAVWHRSGDSERHGDGVIAQRIKATLQKLLNLPSSCHMLYKLNADSLAAGEKEKSHPSRKRTSGEGATSTGGGGGVAPLPSPLGDL